MSEERIDVKIRLRDAARFAAELGRDRKEVDKFGRSVRRAGKDSDRAGKDFRLLGTTLKITAVGAVLAGQGLAATGLAAVALTAALAPMLGLVGALPGLLMLAGQGFGVVAFGMKGVMDAVGPLEKAIDPKKFAALSEPAQNFALVLDALKPRVRALQTALQAGLLPGLTQGLKNAAPALDALKGPLTDTARVLGGFGARLGKLVGSAGFLADLRSQAQFNNVQFRRLSAATVHLVSAFRHLMVGSRGLISWMVKGIAAFASWADRATEAGRASGGLQKGFHTVQVTTSRVLRLFWQFGSALFNIGRIGKRQLGDGILVYLLRAATALNRWTSSEAGIRKIGAAFDWTRRALAGVADFMRRASDAAGPGLADLLRNIIAALNPLISSSGGATILGLYASGMAALAGAAALILNNVPGADTALSALFATMILSKVVPFALLGKALRGIAVAATVLRAPMASMTLAFWALNASIAANPLVWIAGAIIAVGFAFYLAYKKIGWFHRAVDNVWSFIKNNWKTIGTLLVAPLAPFIAAIRWIIGHLGKIKDFLGGIAGKALGAVGKVGGFLGIGGHADGGIIRTPLQLVGERGPELIAAPMGSRVFTAPQTQSMIRAPRTAAVQRSSSGGGAGGREIHVHVHSTLKVDRRTLAKSVADTVVDERAGG